AGASGRRSHATVARQAREPRDQRTRNPTRLRQRLIGLEGAANRRRLRRHPAVGASGLVSELRQRALHGADDLLRLDGLRLCVLTAGSAALTKDDRLEQLLARPGGEWQSMIVLVGEDRAARHHPGNAVARARLVAPDLQLTLHRARDLGLAGGLRRRAWRAEC